MTARDFAYWLQGYFEINEVSGREDLSYEQIQVIRRHLDMVFVHEIDPSFPKEQQADLNKAHDVGMPGILTPGNAGKSTIGKPRC